MSHFMSHPTGCTTRSIAQANKKLLLYKRRKERNEQRELNPDHKKARSHRYPRLRRPSRASMESLVRPLLRDAMVGPEGFTSPLAQMDFREGGTSLVCMSSPEYGDHYSTWQYEKIVPMQRIEYIHNLSDKDRNPVDPVSMGMPADFPRDQRHTVTFNDLGNSKT